MHLSSVWGECEIGLKMCKDRMENDEKEEVRKLWKNGAEKDEKSTKSQFKLKCVGLLINMSLRLSSEM